ncbi:MAG: type II secretion system minor pseudopilin GspJ [Gammaproteobacteria bacterium]
MKARGFTLIELMVALFITAIVFAMGYGGINQTLNSRQGLEDNQNRLNAVQTTMRVMAQDFGQLSLRPVRSPTGESLDAVLVTGQTSQPYVTFTRGGWANPAGVQRPALQRVSYVLEGEKFRREHWPVLDHLLSTNTIRRELLDGVKGVTFRYMDVTRQWRDQWPPQALPGATNSNVRLRPIAVEVTLDLNDLGKIKRIFEVPT